MELIKPSNEYLGVAHESLTKREYQEVCTILSLYEKSKIVEALEILTKEKKLIILESNSQEFLKFVKWLNEQVEMMMLLYKNLEPTELDADDIAFQNAGADRLSIYKENLVYYAIDKNPAVWPDLGKVPFEVMFTKLLIDKDMSAINKNYLKSLKK